MDNRVPATRVDAGWEVLRDGAWVEVDLVAETERQDGSRRLWFYSAGRKALIVDKGESVLAREKPNEGD